MAKKSRSNSRVGVAAWLSEDGPNLDRYLGLGHKENLFFNKDNKG